MLWTVCQGPPKWEDFPGGGVLQESVWFEEYLTVTQAGLEEEGGVEQEPRGRKEA